MYTNGGRIGVFVLTVFLLASGSSFAAAGRERIAWKGVPVEFRKGWPSGISELLNDPLRSEGWWSWFSGNANDVYEFEMAIKTPQDVEQVVALLAKIKAPVLRLRLDPGRDASTPLVPMPGVGVLFSIGHQPSIDRWFERLPEVEPGVRAFGVHRLKQAPSALPPTLTIYVRHPAVDLKKLRVSVRVDVTANYSDAERARKKDDPTLKMIDQFVAEHKARRADADRLHGAWEIVSTEFAGKVQPRGYIHTWIFTGDRLEWSGAGRGIILQCHLHPRRDPKEMDLVVESTSLYHAVPGTKHGLIYRFEGPNLIVCHGDEKDRPRGFHSKPGDRHERIVLKPTVPHHYPLELREKLDKVAPPTTTKDNLPDYLKKRFQLLLPAGSRIEDLHTQVGFVAADWDHVVREHYARIAVEPEQIAAFSKALRKHPLLYYFDEDERLLALGSMPMPAQTPLQVSAWMKPESPWVFGFLSENTPAPTAENKHAWERTGAVIMRISKKTNHIHLWAFERAKEQKAEPNADKPESAEVHGILHVGEPPKPAPDLGAATRFVIADPKVPLTGVTIFVPELARTSKTGEATVDVELPHERLRAVAKELDGRPVLLSGELRTITVIPRSYRSAKSGSELLHDNGKPIWLPLGEEMPLVRPVIRATDLKPAKGKYEPWTGEPSIAYESGGKGKLFTFKRLPKAKDVTAVRMLFQGNRTEKPLTLANFPAVLDGMTPIKADDPKYKYWHYAWWHSADFDTPEGRFRAVFYLGGLAVLHAPDGTSGFVNFEHPK